MGWPKMESRHTLTLSYTVHASEEQAERWKAAAAVQGEMSVGTWLAVTADAHLRELARSGRSARLPWFWDRFRVLVTDTSVRPEAIRETVVRGEVSGPFGIFRGNSAGLGEPGCCQHSLVHLPTLRIIGTLPLRKSCKALAAELVLLRIDWQETDPQKVLGEAPDRDAARNLLRLFHKLTG